MNTVTMRWGLGLSLALILTFPLQATETLPRAARHPISKVMGTFYVTPTSIQARLSLFVEDLYFFQGVEPNDEDRVFADQLMPAREAHGQFLTERVQILDANGQPYPCRVVEISPLEVPEEGWTVDELMDHTIVYDLEYTLPERPEFLTFVQEIVDENFVFPSELEMLIRQEGQPEVTGKILRPSDPFTVRLDWTREPLDLAARQEELEAWREAQSRKETLGITSYDSVYSFLYITRREVRHEILVPLATLARIFEIPREDPNFLRVDEQDVARELIGQYYSEGNPITIDGLAVAPIISRIDFYGLSLKDFATQAEARDVSLANGRVGVILVYPCKQEPATVTLQWTKFTSDIRKVTTVVFTPEGTEKAEFSRFQKPEQNVYRWENPHEIQPRDVRAVPVSLPERPRWPWVSLLVGGVGVVVTGGCLVGGRRTAAGTSLSLAIVGIAVSYSIPGLWAPAPWQPRPQLTPQDQAAVVRTLISNVYRAFDYHDEDDIYNALEQSVSGELLSDLYLQMKSGLVIQEQGGAVALVESVDVVELDPADLPPNLETPDFALRCRWNVEGTVEHWGHIHRRTNQYEAHLDVAAVDGAWRLVGMRVTDEQRVLSRPELRRF